MHTNPTASFRLNARPAVGRVDRAAGRISGVSLVTANRPASGWGMFVDQRTLQLFQTQLAGRRLKAYVTHGDERDPTLEEVGFWSAFSINGDQLLAQFEALASWRKHRPEKFDTLFELAEKVPGEFGASLRFPYSLAWVMANGSEVPAMRIGANSYEPARPAGALRDVPSVRPSGVVSADFVDMPAANVGLFRGGSGAAGGGTPQTSAKDIASLRAQLNAVKGDGASSAKLRGELCAQIRVLGGR